MATIGVVHTKVSWPIAHSRQKMRFEYEKSEPFKYPKMQSNSKMYLKYIAGWQTVYDNDLYKILENHGGQPNDRNRIVGAEVALWTETVSAEKA